MRHAGTIDEIARQSVLEGKVKGAARRAMTAALAIRFTLLMTLTPDADYAEVMAVLLGDLPLVPWQRPCAADRDGRRHLAGSARPAPLERLRDRRWPGSTPSTASGITGRWPRAAWRCARSTGR